MTEAGLFGLDLEKNVDFSFLDKILLNLKRPNGTLEAEF